jgi:hypothetical protein
LAFIGLAGEGLAQRESVKNPHMGYVYPAGGARGGSVGVQVGGENIYGTSAVLVSGNGVSFKVIRSADPYEGKEAKQKKQKKKNEAAIDEVITLKATISSNAAPGNVEFCLVTPDGVSNKLIFQVGQLKELAEVEPNNKAKAALAIPALPAVLNGQIMPGDVDSFSFNAKKGQQMVVEVATRALVPYIADGVPGWFQAIVTLQKSNGVEVGVADNFQFSQDPVLFCEIPADGAYVLTIRDTLYRGREDFVYRMKVGTLPYITSIFPLGSQCGSGPVHVSLLGKNLPGESLDAVMPPPHPAPVMLAVTNGGGLISNRVLFMTEDLPELMDGAARPASPPLKVVLPVVINGRLLTPDERRVYCFDGKKGQAVVMDIHARRLGSPLDSGLVLSNEKGERLAENDDAKDRGEGRLTHQSDSSLMVTLPEDGLYTVTLRDMQGRGGAEYAYRLRITPPRPDFELRVTPAAVSIPKGGSVMLTAYVVRRDGFSGEIKLGLEAPADGLALDGSVIPANTDKLCMTLTATRPRPATMVPHLIGTAMIEGKPVIRRGVPAENLMQAFLYQHLVPFGEETVMITGTNAPFRVIPKFPAKPYWELLRGKEVSFRVEAIRQPGFEGPIRLQLIDPPKGVTFRNANIPPGRDSAVVVVRTESKVVSNLVGNLIISGTMPVEMEATPAERARAEAKAARDREVKAAVLGTNTPPQSVSTNPVIADQKNLVPEVPKPLMIKRQLISLIPAVPYQIIEPPQQAPAHAKTNSIPNRK